MNKIITFGVEKETGLVISRVGNECAVPVLDFEAIGAGGTGDDGIEYQPGDFNGPTRYSLEKCSVYQVGWSGIRWTKKIPVVLKNRHRAYWGFRPLSEDYATMPESLLIYELEARGARRKDAVARIRQDRDAVAAELKARDRLEYLRRELRAERISYGELAELQGLAGYIEPGDTELLQAAGVPEFPDAGADRQEAGR